MLNSSLLQLGAALRSKKISSVELTQLYLHRIAILNSKINAYITVNEEMSLVQARAADVQLTQSKTTLSLAFPLPERYILCNGLAHHLRLENAV